MTPTTALDNRQSCSSPSAGSHPVRNRWPTSDELLDIVFESFARYDSIRVLWSSVSRASSDGGREFRGIW
jgi:hypothetical protein